MLAYSVDKVSSPFSQPSILLLLSITAFHFNGSIQLPAWLPLPLFFFFFCLLAKEDSFNSSHFVFILGSPVKNTGLSWTSHRTIVLGNVGLSKVRFLGWEIIYGTKRSR